MKVYLEWIGYQGRKRTFIKNVDQDICDREQTIVVHNDPDEDENKFIGVVRIDVTYEKEVSK